MGLSEPEQSAMVAVWTTQLDRLRADLTLYASPDVRRLDEKINAGLEKMTEESNRVAARRPTPRVSRHG